VRRPWAVPAPGPFRLLHLERSPKIKHEASVKQVNAVFMRISIRVLFALFLAASGLAQENKPASQQGQTPLFRKNVNLVSVFFTVRGKNGAFIPNLTLDQFEVTEEGQPQAIKYFSAESNLPMTLGMLIDTSESTQRMLSREKIVAGDFLRQVLTDKDLAFVISFDTSVDLQQDITSEVRVLQAALSKVTTHAALSGRLGQGPVHNGTPVGTLLYDAVYLGASDVLSKQAGRKAMIIVTDGVDQGSKLRLRDALEAAQKADVVCYVLVLFDPVYGNDMDGMKQLTEPTGGRAISVSDPKRLEKAFAEISDELRSQYSLGYTPTNENRDGKFRRISVKCKEGYKIQTRKGYYAPTDSAIGSQ
jgi:VWFA-related protein